ncbi:putative phage abortive infection protein [Bilophila wadsworthia]|uniref:putative phage abortive infection protein n=1 Tax=Bilophila wadsworthia TaxID=35833 RepID=UPI002432B304|nr:putative phage abortive infection protein [Bilophila wadsworthia]MDU4375820.1 putative phage abortive infection protein [Bilophila wadsworthia]
MKKNSHALLFCICIAIVLILWLLGGTAYRWSCWPFAGLFGEIDNLENVFSPVGAFFSALASGATFFLIYWQFKEADKRDQEFQIQLFENKFFQLINIHRDNVKNINYSFTRRERPYSYHGPQAFYAFYNMFCYICTHISQSNFMHTASDIIISSSLNKMIKESIMDFSFSSDESLKISEEILCQEIKYQLNMYYHNIYVILKYIDDNTNDEKRRKRYLRIFRSQISVYEYIMIYYHAAIHKENDNDELRFKKLIEKTGFFHNMEKNLIVDLDKNGQQFLTRYDESAFRS